MIKSLLYMLLVSSNPTKIETFDYCNAGISHLSTQNRVELAIGCSEVHGRRVYRDYKLKDIYEQQ